MTHSAAPRAPTVRTVAKIRFAKDDGFHAALRQRVEAHFQAHPGRHGGWALGLKTILILIALAGAYLSVAALPPPPPLDLGDRMDTIKLAVVGAHLEGMPLHWQLTSRNASLVGAFTTAPTYRLYAMADSVPPKPALVHSEEGAAIALEVYELDMASFGSFVAEVPPPLAIGTVQLADGSSVKGFVAEPRALTGAEDITHLGGWRAYIASR